MNAARRTSFSVTFPRVRSVFSGLGWAFLSLSLLLDPAAVCEHSALLSHRNKEKVNQTPAMASVSASNTAFALELLRTLSQEKPSGNIFVSPLSISSALAMVYLGAKGDTATQMSQALSFRPGEGVHADFETLNSQINAPAASYVLKLANRLYGENTCNFLSDFLESTRKHYQADLKSVDFIGTPEDCRAEINSWVEQQTENKIKDLLKQGTVSTMTRLVLVNAIYFKGNWMDKFDAANTKEMPFHVNGSVTKPVQMMYQMKKMPFNYIPELGLQIVGLPYVDNDLSMYILLPEETSAGTEGVHKIESKLTQGNLDEWTDPANMESVDVHVHLPKFKMEEDYELNDPLAKMGMSDVFCSAKADLSGMNGQGGLFLSTVAHKAFVEVNEEGTEAAAATAGMVSFCMFREEHFTADHPFLFLIKHRATNSILFLGRFMSPQ
ncbi:leukocyte elastase inhibitor [Eucyclogobius newberryi]|uniref:leukocyte elastase inhibitor n=1 Tax=Eucyclogobius newberryi TaxID=166745 RepID=UPI003B5A0B6D